MNGGSTNGSTENGSSSIHRPVSRAELLRRSGLALGAAALGAPLVDALASSPALGATYRRGRSKVITMRYAHVFVAGTPQANIIQGFADKVNAGTNGQVQITVYPSSQLGNDTIESPESSYKKLRFPSLLVKRGTTAVAPRGRSRG